MRYQAIIFLTILAVPRSLQAQNWMVPAEELTFPHFAVGGAWESELTLIAQGVEPSEGNILFNSRDGSPIALIVNGKAVSGLLDYHLAPTSSVTYNLSGGSNTETGWILVTQIASSYPGKGPIGGMLTFRYKANGEVVSQVGVPGVRDSLKVRLPYDNTSGNLSAFAFCGIWDGLMEMKRYDEAGTLRDTVSVNMKAMTQKALFLYELFPDSANRRGLLEISGTKAFSILALNVNNSKWSSLAALPDVYDRKLDLQGIVRPIRLVVENQFLYGIAELEPVVLSPITGSFAFKNPGTGGDTILNLNINTFDAATGEAKILVLVARISDTSLRDVSGTVKTNYERGGMESSGTFRIYAEPSKQ